MWLLCVLQAYMSARKIKYKNQLKKPHKSDIIIKKQIGDHYGK